jgi:hypothetical protein
MSQDENENVTEDERKKLKELGVDSTWDILTSGEKKKEESKAKKPFRGFD